LTVTHADLVRLWGESQIRTFPLEHLEGLGLPESARVGLGEIGVPDHTDVLFTATALEPIKLRGVGDAICFGHAWHEEFDLCVAMSDGRVYASHRKAPEVTFVNTDLVRYLEFLVRAATMYRLWDEAAQAGPAESEGYLDELERSRRELTEVDPAALVEGAWWNGVWDDLKLI
jgi:SUKH-4 immunity protein